jgi:OOP family OmpA-OmpF porin
MPKSFEELDKLYALLSSNPNLKISVNGYTDNVGSIKYNLRLSERRAKAVVDYLIEKEFQKID